MLRNILSAPGEAASTVGLIGIAVVTPIMIEERFGALVPISSGWHWLFSWVAGFCGAVGIAQFGAMLLDWRRARLWVARGAVVASTLMLAAYIPVRFYGVSTLAVVLATVNTLSAVRWELRAYEQARE